MAEMVPVTIAGVVQGTDDGPGRRERFFIELSAAAEGDQRRLRIGVGDAEATALAFSLQGTEFPRPMTYQLMAALVAAAGSAVRSVRVTAHQDDIYFAQVILRGGARVDARPSDALNLAVITGAPVFVADTLLGLPADTGRGALPARCRRRLAPVVSDGLPWPLAAASACGRGARGTRSSGRTCPGW